MTTKNWWLGKVVKGAIVAGGVGLGILLSKIIDVEEESEFDDTFLDDPVPDVTVNAIDVSSEEVTEG